MPFACRDEAEGKPRCPHWCFDTVDCTRVELEHEISENCWCEPELTYVDPETGAKVWVHRRIE